MPAQSNSAKFFTYVNGQILYGPSGVGQNLNDDMQKNLADEADIILSKLAGTVIFNGWQVVSASALTVNVELGDGLIDGQYIRSTGTQTVSSLTPSTSGLKIYVELAAGSNYSTTTDSWPATFQFTTGSLTTSQILLATCQTDGTSVTAIVNGRVLVKNLLTLSTEVADVTAKSRIAALGLL